MEPASNGGVGESAHADSREERSLASELKQRVSELFLSFWLMAGWRSRLQLLQAKLGPRLPARFRHQTVELKLRPLNGNTLNVRPGSTDLGTIVHNFIRREHVPPPRMDGRPMNELWELGSNIGTGLAGLACEYPEARVLGVEPDPGNSALARLNIAPYGERCKLIETAIWDEECDLVVEGDDPSGYTVRPATFSDPAGSAFAATTIDQLIAEHLGDRTIDFMVFNLEGTEPRVLAAGGLWPERVRAVRIEIHPHHGFHAADSNRLLSALGYRAWCEPEWWGGYGFGVRD